MASFDKNIFDMKEPLDLSFPQPFYEGQSDYSYPLEMGSCSNSIRSEIVQEKQDVKTTDIAQQIWNNTDRRSEKEQEALFKKELEYQKQIKQKVLLVQKGTKNDTVLLNINFKTMLVSYFRQKMYLNELNEIQIKEVEQFSKRQPSFQSLVRFCRKDLKDSSIRSQMVNLVQSGLIVKKIMESRCMLDTKMQLLKFVEVFRKNVTRGQIVKWKDFLATVTKK